MNQKLLGALEEVYPFKGFAAGGITRYETRANRRAKRRGRYPKRSWSR